MCLVASRTYDDLAEHGVLDATLYIHHHGLVHLVADDTTNEGALALGRCSGLGFAHFTFLPSQPSRYGRARYRDALCQAGWYWKAAVARCIRRLNCAFSRLSSS